MLALDVCMQLYLLHDPTRYARMLRPGARHTYHTVHRTPPCSTRTAQGHACATVRYAVYGRVYAAHRHVAARFTASCPRERYGATDAIQRMFTDTRSSMGKAGQA